MDKLWNIQAMEYYSVLKEKWYSAIKRHGRKLNTYLLNETLQPEKSIYCMIPNIHFGKGKSMETVK